MTPKPKPTAIYPRILRTYAQRARPLLVIGAFIFVPIGLVDALGRRAETIDVGKVDHLTAVALVGGLLVAAATSLFGDVFYSGAVAELIGRTRPGERPSLRRLRREFFFGRLIAVDVLVSLAVAIGLLLLVVPGVLVFTWLALAGPLVEVEGLPVRSALARSHALVRGHFWRVLVIVGPVSLAGEALVDALQQAAHGVLGHSFFADWLAESTANILVAPLFALAAVLVLFELLGRRPPGVAGVDLDSPQPDP